MNKLKSSKGFTLIEMTVTLITVTLVTSLFFIMVSLVKNVYVEMEQLSESQILCSTLTNAIQDELRYASYVETTGEANDGYYSFTYYSESLGIGDSCSITHVKNGTGDDSKYILTIIDGDGDHYDIVSPESYVFNLEAYVEAKYNPSLKKFHVTISVYDSRYTKDVSFDPFGDDALIKADFYIDPLNEKSL